MVSARLRRWEGGFTLIEVLVALAILGISLTAIYEAFGIGLRNERQSRLYQEAVDLAEARLAQVGTELPAGVGQWSGEEGGFHWTLTLRPAADEPLAYKPSLLRLLEVSVEVAWLDRGGRQAVALHSFRLAAQPPANPSAGGGS
jgi:general secretion pathway protein I